MSHKQSTQQATIVNLANPKKAVQELKECAGLALVMAEVEGDEVVLTFREIAQPAPTVTRVELKRR